MADQFEDLLKQDLLDIMTEFLEITANKANKHTSEKSVIKVEDDLTVSLFTPEHLQFAVYGRGPGRNPPLAAIEKWVSSKGIVSDPGEALGIAFAIQKSIGENGTLNYVPGAPNALEEMLEDTMNVYNSELAEQVGFNINEVVKEAWDKILPKKIIINI